MNRRDAADAESFRKKGGLTQSSRRTQRKKARFTAHSMQNRPRSVMSEDICLTRYRPSEFGLSKSKPAAKRTVAVRETDVSDSMTNVGQGVNSFFTPLADAKARACITQRESARVWFDNTSFHPLSSPPNSAVTGPLHRPRPTTLSRSAI